MKSLCPKARQTTEEGEIFPVILLVAKKYPLWHYYQKKEMCVFTECQS